jgi:hypothetical protein
MLYLFGIEDVYNIIEYYPYMERRRLEIKARLCPAYVSTPFTTYNRLMESCTILNPYRRPFVTLRTINQASKAQWESSFSEVQ